MKIEAYLDDLNCEVICDFTIEKMADAVGCEPHERASFPGFCYEIDSCCLADAPFTDIASKLAAHEIEFLTERAQQQHHENRFPRYRFEDE